MPLADGRSWTFALSAVDDSESAGECPSTTATVDGMAPAPNGSGWSYQPACAPIGDRYTMVQDGDDIVAYRNQLPPGIEYMKAPIAEGVSWANYVWRAVGTMAVPAGTFDDCWRRSDQGMKSEFAVFCRGVGIVHTESVETNVRTLLTSKNF